MNFFFHNLLFVYLEKQVLYLTVRAIYAILYITIPKRKQVGEW